MAQERGYTADLGRIEGLIEKLGKFGSKSEEKTGEIDAKHAELGAVWEGQSADSHAEQRDRWNKGEAEMREALKGLKDQAQTSHNNYSELIDHQMNMWPQ